MRSEAKKALGLALAFSVGLLQTVSAGGNFEFHGSTDIVDAYLYGKNILQPLPYAAGGDSFGIFEEGYMQPAYDPSKITRFYGTYARLTKNTTNTPIEVYGLQVENNTDPGYGSNWDSSDIIYGVATSVTCNNVARRYGLYTHVKGTSGARIGLYASTNSGNPSLPGASDTYAGYFDGNVKTLGTITATGGLTSYGNITSSYGSISAPYSTVSGKYLSAAQYITSSADIYASNGTVYAKYVSVGTKMTFSQNTGLVVPVIEGAGPSLPPNADKGAMLIEHDTSDYYYPWKLWVYSGGSGWWYGTPLTYSQSGG